MSHQYDLVIIGLGSGGTLAAEFAAGELGLKVAAVERGRIGGDCLWTGCVPSKALIASARVAHTVRQAAGYGVIADEPTDRPDGGVGSHQDRASRHRRHRRLARPFP